MTESVAAYAAERLAESGESAEFRHRFRAYYMSLAEQAESFLRGDGQREWLRRLDVEHANLRSALDGAVRVGDAECALRLVNALAWYWCLRGRNGEARRSLASALSVAAGSPTVLVAPATAWLGGVELRLGGSADPVGAYRRHCDRTTGIDAPLGKARVAVVRGVQQCTASVIRRRAWSLANPHSWRSGSLGDRWGTGRRWPARRSTRNCTATSIRCAFRGEESLRLFRNWRPVGAVAGHGAIADVCRGHGRLRTRRAAAPRGVADGRGIGAVARGVVPALRLGTHCPAHAGLSACPGVPRAGPPSGDRTVRQVRRTVRRDRPRHGRTPRGRSGRRRSPLGERAGTAPKDGVRAGHARADSGRAGLSSPSCGRPEDRTRNAGRRSTAARAVGDVRSVALALEGLAGAQVLAGHADHAARLLASAAAARRSVGTPLPEGERDDVARIEARARTSWAMRASMTRTARRCPGTTRRAWRLFSRTRRGRADPTPSPAQPSLYSPVRLVTRLAGGCPLRAVCPRW